MKLHRRFILNLTELPQDGQEVGGRIILVMNHALDMCLPVRFCTDHVQS